MMNTKRTHVLRRALALVCIFALLLSAFPVSITAQAAGTNESKIIVSMGDSYSAGEGIPPFGKEFFLSKKVQDPDWLAHRSQFSWPSMLMLPSVKGPMSMHRNENWFFTAVSGAETIHFYSEQKKLYYRESLLKPYIGSMDLPPQLDIFDQLNGKKADYVTMTIGGNDAGFAKIIKDGVVLGSTYLKFGDLEKQLDDTWDRFYEKDGIEDDIRQAYKDVSLKAGSQAKIIVAGYPTLLSPGGVVDFISIEEAMLVNENVRKFNKALESLVNSCWASGMNIYFVSVEKEFNGREAHSSFPYLNGIIPFAQSEDLTEEVGSAYSVHPNLQGAMAYARCVQAKINELEGITEEEYATNLSVSTQRLDGSLCDNYTLKVSGEESLALWGLVTKAYEKEIVVTDAKNVSLDLPEGKYVITVTDGQREYRQAIKISEESRNNLLTFVTDFCKTNEEPISGQFDPDAVLSDAVTFNGHWYKVIHNPNITSGADAQHYCQSLGGYLATISSKEENDFLFNYVKDEQMPNAYFGYSDEASEGKWSWVNGEWSTYTNWHYGEPNNDASGEDYTQFYYTDGTWNDGDFSSRTFICEWGEYRTEQESQTQEPVRTTSDERDIVLVLDVSGSMSGTPLAETKKAATNFVETILKQDASIGIVTYSSSADRIMDFSVDEQALKYAVSSIYESGMTNMDAGLSMAQSMLHNSNAKKKIIVLMSDGIPNEGRQGDGLISFADEIKQEGILIYTLGFFEDLGSDKASAQALMDALASDGCHYEVADADQLVFFFEDMADQINGTKYIYVRIACPVDVTVTHDGQTLSSAAEMLNQRTDFGTLTFEENENPGANEDDRIKVLRLKEGVDYDLEIVGTGRGMMDYTIGFMDEDGTYSDLREFENVKITKNTVIDTVAAVSRHTVLNIDEDGDGRYDVRYRAEENGKAEEIKDHTLLFLCVGGGIFILLVVLLVIRRCRKRRKGR